MKKKIPWFVKFWHDHNGVWLSLFFWTEIGAAIYRMSKGCPGTILMELLLFPLTMLTISISYCIIDGIFCIKYYPDEYY